MSTQTQTRVTSTHESIIRNQSSEYFEGEQRTTTTKNHHQYHSKHDKTSTTSRQLTTTSSSTSTIGADRQGPEQFFEHAGRQVPSQTNNAAPARPSRPARKSLTQNFRENPPAESPQRLRMSQTFAPNGAARCASAAGPRAHAHAHQHHQHKQPVATRMGRFVNYYPASRQPQSPTRRWGSGRATSPYAFHVPPSYIASSRTALDRPYTTTSSTSRATSPSYAYAYDFYPSPTASEELDGRGALAAGPTAVPHQQARFGYVAPARDDDDLDDKLRKPPPASKFNKSLRSRTISHLPSMVQVSVATDESTAALVGPVPLGVHAANEQLLHESPLRASNATSEGNLLKAHVVPWRSSDFGHENPFKPGTELSLEADLMVRLIKRGYPMEELPHLVEAAKSEVVSRSKSCDRLQSGRGFLRSNLRNTASMGRNQPPVFGHSQSHYELSSHAKGSPVELQSTHGQRLEAKQRGATIGHEPSLSRNETAEKFQPDDPKSVWANSLKRAKSMPRGLASFSKASVAARRQADADSLDKLITSIELEISDLLSLQEKQQQQQDPAVQAHSEKQTESPARAGAHDKRKGPSPTKAKGPKRTGSEAGSELDSPSRRKDLSRTQVGSQVGGPRTNNGKAPNPAQVEPKAIKKRDKPRCCSIQ